MKRWFFALVGLLFLAGCIGGGGMTVSYLTPQETPIKIKPVYLKIEDRRTEKSIPSVAVTEKDLFKGVTDRVSLNGKTIDGRTIDVKDVPIKDAFQEAFRLRLEALGVGVLPEFSEDKLGLIIEIRQVQLDLEGFRTFKASVEYVARFMDGARELEKKPNRVVVDKPYILGQSDGEAVLSDAFTSAINAVDLRRFQLTQ